MMEKTTLTKVSLGIFPTPVQKLENISRVLGVQVFVKRDDLTGIGLGGNKVRKLEYLLADAKTKGAQIVFVAQHRIDTAVIAGIIAVVGGGLKDGAHVNGSDT